MLVSAYQFNTITSFDELHTALRWLEKQHAKPAALPAQTAPCKSAKDRERKKEEKKEQLGKRKTV